MNPSAMKQAIKQRRGQGLEISILVGPASDKKETDLAPPGKSPEGKMPEEGAQAPMPEEMAPMSDPASPMPSQQMSDEISPEHEEEISQHILNGSDPSEEMNHNPRSLGERAKMALMAKMKQKQK